MESRCVCGCIMTHCKKCCLYRMGFIWHGVEWGYKVAQGDELGNSGWEGDNFGCFPNSKWWTLAVFSADPHLWLSALVWGVGLIKIIHQGHLEWRGIAKLNTTLLLLVFGLVGALFLLELYVGLSPLSALRSNFSCLVCRNCNSKCFTGGK